MRALRGPFGSTTRSACGLVLLSCLLAGVTLSAAASSADSFTTITIGTGTSSTYIPMATYFHDARAQVIYLASEIGIAGTINSLALDVTTVPGQTMTNWTIRMQHTSMSSYPASPAWEGTGWTVCYQANQLPGVTGWQTLNFTTPFSYDGTSNLLIDFSFNNTSSSSDGMCRYSEPGGNRTIYYETDSGFGDPLLWSGTSNPMPGLWTYVPNVQLTLSPSGLGVTSITPDSGTNDGTVDIADLAGWGFEAGATVKLQKTGETDISGTSVTVVSSTKITCTFDLTGAASGAWDVVVTNPSTESATLAGGFTVYDDPPPTVTSITPDSGTNDETVNITDLAGTGFQTGATVKLAKAGEPDIDGTSVTVVSSTKITCTFDLTGVTIGEWDVVVTNPDTQSGTLPGGFTVIYPPLTVTSITPNSGTTGTTVNITDLAGTGFQTGATVKLTKTGEADINATDVTVVSSTQITCRFDLTGAASGMWDVVVTNADSQSATLPGGFTVYDACVATLPFNDGFESGGLACYWCTYSSDTGGRITVTTDNGPHSGSYHLTMDRDPSGTYTLNELILAVDLSAHPNVVLGFWHKHFGDEPDSMPSSFTGHSNSDGVAISADGNQWYSLTDFPSRTDAYSEYDFDLDAEAAAAGISFNSSFKIKFQQYDNYPLTTDGFAFDDIVLWAGNLPPTVTSITPDMGANDGTVAITDLAGDRFATGATVKLSKTGQTDINGTSVVVVSATKITCTFDLTGAAAGKWDVVVTNPDAGSGTLVEGVTVYAAPTVFSITPNRGTNDGTVDITDLAGLGFHTGATVKLQKTEETDIPGTSIVVVSSTQITCTFNLNGVGTGLWDVVVTNPDTQSGTLTEGFRVVQAGDGLVNYWAVLAGADANGAWTLPANDMHDFYGLLMSSDNWQSANIQVLTDGQATKANIQAAIQTMANSADSDDLCLWYSVGHGGPVTDVAPLDEPDGYDEALYFHNHDRILDDEFSDWMAPIATDKVCVIIESCYSGGQIYGRGGDMHYGIGPGVPVTDGFVDDLTRPTWDLDDNGVGVVVTACDDDESAWITTGSFVDGYFSHYVKETMQGPGDANSNGWISGEEVYDYAAPRVTAAKPIQHPQLYDVYGGELDFLDLGPTDSSPPTCVIDYPADGGIYGLAGISQVSGTASDPAPGSGVNYTRVLLHDVDDGTYWRWLDHYWDGDPTEVLCFWAAAEGGETWQLNSNLPTTWQDGHTYEVTAKSFDNAYNEGTPTTNTFSISSAPPVTVTSITPNSGTNDGTVDITNLAGTGFQTGATVNLEKTGETDVGGTSVVVVSSTKITCTFDLTGEATGAWSVTVTNTDMTSGTLTNGFTVNPSGGTIVAVMEDETIGDGSSADHNFHDDTFQGGLRVGRAGTQHRGYLKFDLSAISGGATISQATLWVYLNDEVAAFDRDIGVYQTTDGWSETTITWNNAPAPAATPADTVAAPVVPGQWYQWDVTAPVATEHAGDAIVSLVLRENVESGDDTGNYWTEKDYDPALAAYLQVTTSGAGYAISGQVKKPDDTPLGGVTVSTTGASDVTDSNGEYQLTDLAEGDHEVTPVMANYDFVPTSTIAHVDAAHPDVTGIDFVGTYLGTDSTPPTVEITYPADGTYPDIDHIEGTAEDEAGGSGVRQVKLVILTQDGSTFWNGIEWGPYDPVASWLPTDGTTNWSKTTGLPSPWPDGDYYIDAWGWDNAGNETPSAYRVAITISGACVATLPFNEGFESGSLACYWYTYSSDMGGRILVTTGYDPHSGSYHLTMDRDPSGTYTLNELILAVDLSAHPNVVLGFWHKHFSDEPDSMPSSFTGHSNSDGVAISADGSQWYSLTDFPSRTEAYSEYDFDLDAEAAAAGISVSSSFKIKFQQYDNWWIDSDGFAFDDIYLRDGSLGPRVTSITPDMGANDGSVDITDLAGENFQTGATVKLQKTGETDISGTSVNVESSTKITCTFDLTGAAAGKWDVVVTNPDAGSGTLVEGFTVYAAPTVFSITPNRGTNDGTVDITDLAGLGFHTGATVKLTKTGEPDINGTSVVVVSSTKITCTFDLNGVATSKWDVVVTNPDTQSGTLAEGFRVVQAGDGLVNYWAVLAGADANGAWTLPANDVEDFYGLLMWGQNWQSANIQALTDAQATKANIQAAIQAMVASSDADDVCLWYSVGHGGPVPDVPPLDEPDGYDEALYFHNGDRILDDEFSDWMAPLETDKVCVIIESCYSGGHIYRGGGDMDYGIGPRVPVADGFVDDLMRPKWDLDDNGVGVVVTACDDDESAYINTGSFVDGYFSYYVRESMKGAGDANSNGWVSGEEVYDYAAPCVTADVSIQHPQLHDVYGGQLEFLELGPTDSDAPTCVIGYPADSTVYGTTEIDHVSGTASDPTPGSGVNYTRVLLHDVTDDTYWYWLEQYWASSYVLSNWQAAQGAETWQLNSNLPTTWQEGHTYEVTAKSFDNVGNEGSPATNLFFVSDTGVVVTSITPASGWNDGTVDITDLAGAGFQAGATVKLTKTGETDIDGTSVAVVSSTKITCTFDLTGAATGAWSVTVTNPDTTSGTLTDGFTVTEPGTVIIGTGRSSAYFPMGTFYHDERTQVIYLASEIGMPGTINSLALDVTTVPGQTMTNWTIRMKHTSMSSYPSPAAWEGTGWTVCYQGDEPQDTTGWRTFTFTTPFDYDGTSNLLVDFSFNNTSYTSDGQCRYSTPGDNRTIYYRTDSGFGDPLLWSGTSSPIPSVSTNVPNLMLTLDASGPTVTSITPNSGTTGTIVDITDLAGTSFQIGATVKLTKTGETDIDGTSVNVESSTKITCTFDLTTAAVGAWDVIVTNPDTQSGTLPGGFTVTYAPPTVTSITPNASVAGIVSITDLAGTNFQTGATVKLTKTGETDIDGTSVVVVSSTQITCTFDLTDAAGGSWDLVVCNPDGQCDTKPCAFCVRTVTGITPNSGTNDGTVGVTVTGTCFEAGMTVKLTKTGETSIPGTSLVVVGATELSCTFDLTGVAIGNWDVVVTWAGAQSATLTDGFEVIEGDHCPPQITGWAVAATHGAVGELICPITDGYIESCTCAIACLLIDFTEPLDPATVDTSVIQIVGITNGDVSGLVDSATLEGDGSRMRITTSSTLPDPDWYTVTILDTVCDPAGNGLDDDRDIKIGSLHGDANSSETVTGGDLLAVRAHIGETLDCSNRRYDVNCSGTITGGDLLAARVYIGNSLPLDQ